jgi:hypothetical protein
VIRPGSGLHSLTSDYLLIIYGCSRSRSGLEAEMEFGVGGFSLPTVEVCDAVFTAKVANQSARRAKPFPGQPIARTPFITVRFSSSTTSHLVTSHFRDIHLK